MNDPHRTFFYEIFENKPTLTDCFERHLQTQKNGWLSLI